MRLRLRNPRPLLDLVVGVERGRHPDLGITILSHVVVVVEPSVLFIGFATDVLVPPALALVVVIVAVLRRHVLHRPLHPPPLTTTRRPPRIRLPLAPSRSHSAQHELGSARLGSGRLSRLGTGAAMCHDASPCISIVSHLFHLIYNSCSVVVEHCG